ncbi:MAG: DUF3109 family protein [Bacteroidota bacterium]|nr:DUF3109 family protein [Bacteroidota bacterium]
MNDLKIGKFKIDPVLFNKGFAKGCGPYRCQTTCCSSGVFADPTERDVILQHTEAIKTQMDETQTTNDAAWFETRIEHDEDFPSGYAVGTEVYNNKCVFLRKDGRCSVQLVSGEKYNDPWKIKPFYCIAFPIVVIDGILTFDDYQQDEAACCSVVNETETTLVDSCKAELEFVLGKEGYQQLLEYKMQWDKIPT